MPTRLNVLVVEDEVIVSEEISECLQGFGYNVVGQATSAQEALRYLENVQLDVALLDINIQGNQDGIELAKKIREQHNCSIIFLTAYSDDAILDRAKKVKPEAYLVKPFEKNNLYAAINLAFDNYNGKPVLEVQNQKITDRIFLREGQKYIKVFIRDVLFIEAIGSYCKIVTGAGQYIYSFNLKTAIEKVVHPDLVRVHRSYLVNVRNIDSIDGNQLQLGNHTIQMSQAYRDAILSRFNLL